MKVVAFDPYEFIPHPRFIGAIQYITESKLSNLSSIRKFTNNVEQRVVGIWVNHVVSS